jgi:hypothetical protein
MTGHIDEVTIYVSVLFPIIVAVVMLYAQRAQNRRDQKRDAKLALERANATEQCVLMFESLQVLGELTYANSVAIKEHKVDGVMSNAMKNYLDNRDHVNEFLRKQAAENIAS